jgi:Cytochrome c
MCFISCNSRQDSSTTKSSVKSPGDSLQIQGLINKYRQGKEKFQIKCAACHVALERHVTDQYIFDGLFDKLPKPSDDYFIRFIKNGKALKESGDKYSQKLAEDWNSNYDHVFQETLSNQDLENLLIYIKVAIKQKYRE